MKCKGISFQLSEYLHITQALKDDLELKVELIPAAPNKHT